VLKLLADPLAGVPPVAVQAKVYGAVPPVAEAVQATAVPTVPVAGHVAEAVSASGEMTTVAVADAVFALESVAVTEIVKVPLEV